MLGELSIIFAETYSSILLTDDNNTGTGSMNSISFKHLLQVCPNLVNEPRYYTVMWLHNSCSFPKCISYLRRSVHLSPVSLWENTCCQLFRNHITFCFCSNEILVSSKLIASKCLGHCFSTLCRLTWAVTHSVLFRSCSLKSLTKYVGGRVE